MRRVATAGPSTSTSRTSRASSGTKSRDASSTAKRWRRIQADFVDRYGEKVLAARSDAPARNIATVLLGLTLVAGAALAMTLRRWTRRTRAKKGLDTPAAPDRLDARIDAELADLDG